MKMNAQKMLGWCLIVMGLVHIFRAIHLSADQGQEVGPIFVFITALLFTGGAALLWRASRINSKT
jgi:hypothetical protein